MAKKGEVGARLAQWLDAAGFRARTKLAASIDVTPQRLSNWLSGHAEVPHDRYQEIAAWFGRTVEELTGQVPTVTVRELSTPYYPVGFQPRQIRLLSAVPCGMWEEPTESEDFIEIDAKFEHPKRYATYVTGDSCFPVLQQGDLAIWHEDFNPSYGLIVLARRKEDHAATVKRLVYDTDGKGATLKPVNPDADGVDSLVEWGVIARLVGIIRTQEDGTELSFYNPRGIRR